MLQGKKIVVGISGGIAAYKIPELIRLLRKAGAEVQVTTTKHALEFVTSLTLQTLSGHRVYSDVVASTNEHSTEHISLPEWADAMLIAPATADVLAKMAHGIADDALTTTFAAMRKPVVIAPAMNDKMYCHPFTQQAFQYLRQQDHITLLDCAEGFLACGSTGKGRMQEASVLMAALEYAITPKTLWGKHVLITAGPTQEQIDPVRFISNYSSGKMGFALAKACLKRGARVTLIAGPTSLDMSDWVPFAPLTCVPVQSAQQMCDAATRYWTESSAAILCAAVADFAPSQISVQKIKKIPGQTEMTLSLSLNPDIAARLGNSKHPHQRLIGFALETENAETNAITKMQTKHLDAIVLNSLRDAGAGFGTDTNKVTVLFPNGTKKHLPLMSKEEVADTLLDELISLF